MRRCAALAALVVLAAAGAAEARTVRVFAVGPKLDLAWLDTREHFRGKLLALLDSTQRGEGTPIVQKGLGDVASRRLGPTDTAKLVATARDLVAFPEDLGLMTIFTGERGRTARGAGGIIEAIVDVLGAYAPQVAYYSAKYPALTQRPLPTRLLNLAATDTFGRVAVETYAELAAKYGVWLEAGVNMAREWQVVCTSKADFEPLPGGPGCDVEDPAKVAQLQTTDDPGRSYAYEATTPQAANMSLLFDPSGKLVAREAKSYLTPTELASQLDLYPNDLDGLRVIDTPVGRLGFPISRDAFTPAVMHLLDQRHMEVMVQPEFFVNDLPQVPGMWSPDVLKASGYAALLRYPAVQSLVVPSMTGNVFDFAADAQQHIGVKPRSRRAKRGFLVGQPPAPGLTQVAPYVVDDPATPGETIAARRARIAEAARHLPRDGGGPDCPAADEPGPCRNGQVENILVQDLEVARRTKVRRQARRKLGRTPFSVSRPLAASTRAQRNVALAGRGRVLYAALEERVADHDQLVVTRSADGGRRWRRCARPTGIAKGTADEWWPAVAVDGDGTLWAAWSDDASGRHRVSLARSMDGCASFAKPVAVDSALPETRQYKPALTAPATGKVLVTWVGLRTEQSGEPGVAEAGIWLTTVGSGGAGEPRRMDQAEPTDQTSLDNAWAPSLASAGRRVVLSYMDSATADWRIWARTSTDAGATFGDEKPVNDTPPVKTDPVLPPVNEALNESPAASWTTSGPLVAFTDFRKHDASKRAHSLYDTLVSAPGAKNTQADGRGSTQQLTFWPAIVGVPGAAIVAWQDHGRGPGDVLATRIRAGKRGKPVRVDDSGTRGWNQWRPALAAAGRFVVAAWEDERDGPPQIFVARAAANRIR